MVRLHGSGGQSPPEAVLEGAPGGCSVDGSTTVCTLSDSRSGHFEFDIQPTGYEKVHVSETVAEMETHGSCCSCGYMPRAVDVQLKPQ